MLWKMEDFNLNGAQYNRQGPTKEEEEEQLATLDFQKYFIFLSVYNVLCSQYNVLNFFFHFPLTISIDYFSILIIIFLKLIAILNNY